jgi:hypothetical protein
MTLIIGQGDGPPSPSGRTIHLGSLMGLIALIAFGLFVTRESPVLGTLLIVFVTPALWRTILVIRREARRGQRLSFADTTTVFLATIGAWLVICMAWVLGFVVMLVPAAIILGPLGNEEAMSAALVVAVAAGVVAGYFTARQFAFPARPRRLTTATRVRPRPARPPSHVEERQDLIIAPERSAAGDAEPAVEDGGVHPAEVDGHLEVAIVEVEQGGHLAGEPGADSRTRDEDGPGRPVVGP